MIKRTAIEIIREIIEQDKKMAFVSGPRQVGKTTLARQYHTQFGQGLYLNWDIPTHQKRILTDPLFFEKENRDPGKPFLVVLDESTSTPDGRISSKGPTIKAKRIFVF
jgi:predicted AAA+ superfamily ATPase